MDHNLKFTFSSVDYNNLQKKQIIVNVKIIMYTKNLWHANIFHQMGTLPLCIVRAFLGCKVTTSIATCVFSGELASSWTLREEGAIQ
jgi:hypothetical protein